MIDLVIRIVLETLRLFLKVSHWIVLGFLVAGLIREFVPRKWFLKMFGGSGIRDVLIASIMGTLAQFLPHSGLPLAISLFHLGASRGAVVTFMVSTPWLCVIESLILISFVGTNMFLFIVVMTMVVGIIGGLLIGYLEKRGVIESGHPSSPKPAVEVERNYGPETIKDRMFSALHYSYDFFKLASIWIAIGFLGAGITKALIPAEIIENLLGYSLHSVLLALAVGTVMEVAVEASVPIICSLYSLGASPGVIFTLLMCGVVTDMTEMGTIWTALGKKTAVASVLIFSFLTLIFGYLINLLPIFA